MTLDLLQKIFTNAGVSLTQEEAEQKAIVFFNLALKHLDVDAVQDNFEDYWIQLSPEWDLNIYDGGVFAGDDLWHLVLYPMKGNTTDTENRFDITEKFYEKETK